MTSIKRWKRLMAQYNDRFNAKRRTGVLEHIDENVLENVRAQRPRPSRALDILKKYLTKYAFIC